MTYTKTNWVNGSTPALNADNLNKIEQGIADAHTQKAPINNPTFTGTVTLPADPTTNLGAATKQYVDNNALPKTGGTMTGKITVNYPGRFLDTTIDGVALETMWANTNLGLKRLSIGYGFDEVYFGKKVIGASSFFVNSNEVWHTGTLRTSNGYPEIYYNGAWYPLGTPRPVGKKRTASWSANKTSATPVNYNTWVTAVNVSGVPGVIYGININEMSDYIYGKIQVRVTIDGVTETLYTDDSAGVQGALSGFEWLYESVGGNNYRSTTTMAPVYFNNSLKVEFFYGPDSTSKPTDTSSYYSVNGSVIYALAVGTA